MPVDKMCKSLLVVGVPLVFILASGAGPGMQRSIELWPQVVAVPEYPLMALYGGIGNQIYCRALIDEHGRVQSVSEWTGVVTVPGSDQYDAGRSDFREAVEKALQRWRFPEGPPGRALVLEFDFQFHFTDEPPGVWARYINPNRVVIVSHRRPREVQE